MIDYNNLYKKKTAKSDCYCNCTYTDIIAILQEIDIVVFSQLYDMSLKDLY